MKPAPSQIDRSRLTDDQILDHVVDDFTKRLRAGETPAIAKYQDQYPELKEQIADLLGSVAMIEQLKSSSSGAAGGTVVADSFERPQQIGEYEILRELGRGGMGVVYEALHQTLGRRVAIKVLPVHLASMPSRVERFRTEAQAAAKLHHTNIVGVFGVGTSEPYHYYVMDYVDGIGLDQVIGELCGRSPAESTRWMNDETRIDSEWQASTPADSDTDDSVVLSTPALRTDGGQTIPRGSSRFRWIARIGASLADALAYAHDQQILHRDIKPSNFLLGRDGVCRITDFGLAKHVESDSHLTKTGDLIGTPQYLAPESLEGIYDRRSEVYCLGLTLYELLALQPAYAGQSAAELIRAVASSQPARLRRIDRSIPLDLATVVEKAIEREPSARYAAADDLRQDLLAFAEGRAISARRASTLDHARRWARTNPLAAGLSALSLLLLTLVAMVSSIGYFATADALGKLREQTDRLHEQQTATERALEQAVENERKTAAQYARAEANMEISMQAFDEMFRQIMTRGVGSGGDVNVDGFRELIGLESSITKQDAQFLEKLVGFYEEFASLNEGNAALAFESAKAWRRVANINQLVGQTDRAADAYRQAIRLFESVFDQNSATDESAVDAAASEAILARVQTGNELVSLQRSLNESRSSSQEEASILRLIRQLPVEQLSDDLKLEAARTLNAVGVNLALQSGTQPTPDFRAQAGRRPPPRPDDENADRQRDRRRPPDRTDFSRHFMRMGQGKRYEKQIEKAIEIVDGLLKTSPDNPEYLSTRASCYCSLAALKMPVNLVEGRAARERAIGELEQLTVDYPESAEYRYLLALACAVGDHETEADEARLWRSVNLAQDLIDDFAEIPEYRQLSANALVKLAEQQRKNLKLVEAATSLRSAFESIQKLQELTPSKRTFLRSLMGLGFEMQELAAAFERQGDRDRARELRQHMQQIRNQLMKRQSGWRNDFRDRD